MKKSNRKEKILMLITLLGFFIVVGGATYAYFVAQGGATSNSSVRIQTSTTDNLSFSVGSSVNLTADQTSFASGKGNVTGSTTATALLTPNNATNKATNYYNIYFNITNNSFIYTTSDNQAELLLQITDPNGNVVTSIDGLSYVTSGGASGFDITTITGSITIAIDYAINANGTSKSDTWKIGVVLVNLDSDQTKNAGKSFSATAVISKDKKVTLASHIRSLYTSQGANGLYYHDASLANGAGDGSYRYSGANPNNYVCFGSTTSPCPTDNLYRIIGVFGDKVKLIKSDYATSALLGTNGDYSGSETPNAENYKGSLTTVNTYYWNFKNNTSINSENGSNTWSTSLLNKTNLNTNFITNIGTEWANKIATTTWKVGGNTYSNISKVVPAVAYQNEIVNPVTTNTTDNATEYTAKIGLMYASDYGFAADPSAWTKTLYDYDGSVNGSTIRSLNWMYMGGYKEWPISRYSGDAYDVFSLYVSGYVGSDTASVAFVVRPSFNLESSVTYVSGSGSADDPIRIG